MLGKGVITYPFASLHVVVTCPIILGNKVCYDCKSYLEIKRTPKNKLISHVNDSQMWNIFKHTNFFFPLQNAYLVYCLGLSPLRKRVINMA